MKETGILFKGFLVRKILAGVKTQTRRLARFEPYHEGAPADFSAAALQVGHYCTGVPTSGWVLRSRGAGGCWNDRTKPLHCPYGAAGDRLWVRETWGRGDRIYPHAKVIYREECPLDAEDLRKEDPDFKWMPSIFMPRWASRINLDISEVRVQRAQEISGADIWAEGFECPTHHPRDVCLKRDEGCPDLRAGFAAGWDGINGARPGGSWASNPWVSALTFRRLP